MSVGCIIGHNRLVGTDSPVNPVYRLRQLRRKLRFTSPAGKSRKQQLRLLQKRRRINANPAKRIQGKKAAAFDGQRYLALKTNVIYDACALLNLAVEMQVHKKDHGRVAIDLQFVGLGR